MAEGTGTRNRDELLAEAVTLDRVFKGTVIEMLNMFPVDTVLIVLAWSMRRLLERVKDRQAVEALIIDHIQGRPNPFGIGRS